MSHESGKLFAVLLGGRAPGCRVELHDVAFAIGQSLEDIHESLLSQWFGEPDGLHVDAYAVVDQVEGYRVRLAEQAPDDQDQHLYFINIGGYRAGEFAEQHAYALLAARNKSEAKARAKKVLLRGHQSIHKDDLFDVDDVLELRTAGDAHVHLHPDPEATAPEVINGYFPLPRTTIEAWLKKR
ncbi:MAG: DUF1543 domain-containing protein [Wenzhouxiangella sp.]|jgi:hypothetical protein|nr:DUF1543 domain-containing protein [Wenzhouxiangella sp.]